MKSSMLASLGATVFAGAALLVGLAASAETPRADLRIGYQTA